MEGKLFDMEGVGWVRVENMREIIFHTGDYVGMGEAENTACLWE